MAAAQPASGRVSQPRAAAATGGVSLGSPTSQHTDHALGQQSRAQGQVRAPLPLPQLWKGSVSLPPSLSPVRVRVCCHKHFITFCVQSLISLCVGAAKTASLKLLLNSLLFFFSTGCTAFFLSFLSPNPYACFSGSGVVFPPSRSPGLCAVKAAELLSSSNKYY